MTSFNLDGTINKLSLVNWNNQFVEEEDFKAETRVKMLAAMLYMSENLH